MLTKFTKFLIIFSVFLSFVTNTHQSFAQSNKNKLHIYDKTVVVQLKWYHQFQFAGYYAALEKGYYKEAGLDVILKEGGPTVQLNQELLSGRADFLVQNTSLLIDRSEGAPVVALAAIFQHSPAVLLTSENSGIKVPTDLLGKKIMLDEHIEVGIKGMLLKEGIELNQIKFLPHSWKVDDLVNGKADVMTAYTTNEPYYLKQKGIGYRIIDPANYGIDFYSDCLYTTEHMVRKQPEVVKAFKKATLKGWEYAFENPTEIINLLIARYGVMKKPEHINFEAQELRKLVLPEIVELGHMNRGRWDHILDFYQTQGLIASDFNLEGFLYESYLFSADESIRKLIPVFGVVFSLLLFALIILAFDNKRCQRIVKEKTENLANSERQLAKIIDLVPHIIYAKDKEGNFFFGNKQMAAAYGLTTEELKGNKQYRLHASTAWNEVDKFLYEDNEIIDSGREKLIENEEFTFADGTKHILHTNKIPFDYYGEAAVLGVSVDITEQNINEKELRESQHKLGELNSKLWATNNQLIASQEELIEKNKRFFEIEKELRTNRDQLKVSLDEKTVLLQEIHHRVKNNMQIICSIINLQMNAFGDPAISKILKDLQTRIYSMSSVHDELYQTQKLSVINVFDYVNKLADFLSQVHTGLSAKVDLKIFIDSDLELPVEKAIPFGLILNELISNAFKYAFKEIDKGSIKIAFAKEQSYYVMVVEDNGVGVSDDFDPSDVKNGSLGMTLIGALVGQLEGELSITNRDGAVFTVKFPIKNN